MTQLTYQIAFASLRGITRTLANEILSRIGDENAFFNATEQQLESLMGFKNKILTQSYRKEILEKAKKETEFIANNNVQPIYYTDKEFPYRLTECDDAPLILYTVGKCDLNSSHIISIVGTRHATPYGIDFTTRLIEDLSKSIDNIVIVSGLAYGIDIVAHNASLRNNIPTVAVLAHGLNTIYPAAHRNIAVEIVRNNGMLITDYRSIDAIHKGNFVARNRIVASLCDCLVVAESAQKGGALITAGIASSYNRDVFALPGRSSDKYSSGCNRLIASNVAALIESADDLIAAMRWSTKPQEGEQQILTIDISEEEQAVIDYLATHDDTQINQLCVALNYPIARLMGLLIDMEFKGLILTYPGGRYRLA
ncbi:MAG: DNA-processing protein DprA [Muribaculaceae bacterium]|nr:DNA-processing protein DprA [Muribaculaceae bacterium]